MFCVLGLILILEESQVVTALASYDILLFHLMAIGAGDSPAAAGPATLVFDPKHRVAEINIVRCFETGLEDGLLRLWHPSPPLL